MPITPLSQPVLRQNALLSALPDADRESLVPHLQLVQLDCSTALDDCGAACAWFPATCVLSVQYLLPDGACTEVACVGNEGMAGLEAVIPGAGSSCPVLLRSPGAAWRIRAALLAHAMRRSPALQAVLMRYSQLLLAQVMQIAACNRHHSVEQQFCRCLLASLDRQQGNALHMTQEFIAGILGVRRESITDAARRLQRAGTIHYSRGNITVLDRAALEHAACDCYRVVRDECEKLDLRAALAA